MFDPVETTKRITDKGLIISGASTANLSLRSIYVVVNTNLAACGGGIGWTLLEYWYTQKFSIIGFCSGIISGLVGITPAAGFGKLIVSFFGGEGGRIHNHCSLVSTQPLC